MCRYVRDPWNRERYVRPTQTHSAIQSNVDTMWSQSVTTFPDRVISATYLQDVSIISRSVYMTGGICIHISVVDIHEDKKRPLGRLSGLYTSMHNRKVFLDGSVLKDSLIADPPY